MSMAGKWAAVANIGRPAENVIASYNKRGPCERWIKEGEGVGHGYHVAPVRDRIPRAGKGCSVEPFSVRRIAGFRACAGKTELRGALPKA